MSIPNWSTISYFDTTLGRRSKRTYKTMQAVGDRLRSLARDEMECVFVPSSYESDDDNLEKRQDCFMFLTELGIYPLRLDMPDNEKANSSEYFNFDDITDYDMVIFESFDFNQLSYTEAYIYNTLTERNVIFLY